MQRTEPVCGPQPDYRIRRGGRDSSGGGRPSVSVPATPASPLVPTVATADAGGEVRHSLGSAGVRHCIVLDGWTYLSPHMRGECARMLLRRLMILRLDSTVSMRCSSSLGLKGLMT